MKYQYEFSLVPLQRNSGKPIPGINNGETADIVIDIDQLYPKLMAATNQHGNEASPQLDEAFISSIAAAIVEMFGADVYYRQVGRTEWHFEKGFGPASGKLAAGTHTPGPWNFLDGEILADRDMVVACVTVIDDLELDGDADKEDLDFQAQLDANGRLIAAAPDLLAACQAVLKDGVTESARDLIQAAIAKAK